MSTTPRTDKLYGRVWTPANEDEATESLAAMRDLSCKLERELATARAETANAESRLKIAQDGRDTAWAFARKESGDQLFRFEQLEVQLASRRLELVALENTRIADNKALLADLDEAKQWSIQRAGQFAATEQRLATELALAKEANAQRAAKFQAQQKKLVTLIRQFHAEVREYRAKKVLWEGELFTLRFYANDMATDLEAMRRGIDWAMLCAAPEEPALVMYRKYQREHP